MCLCLGVCMCLGVYVPAEAKGFGTLGAGVTGSRDLPDAGAGN